MSEDKIKNEQDETKVVKSEDVEVESAEASEEKGFFTETKVEVIVAIFLGVVAVLTAWATWCGSLHGGNQATNYTKSNNENAEANSMWNEASQNLMQDMLLWNDISDLQLDIMYAQSIDDDNAVELSAYKLYYKCLDNLSEDMAAKLGFDYDEAVDSEPVDYVLEWIENEDAVNSPFDDEFVDSYYYDAQALLDQAQETLEQGQTDNKNGDHFNLVVVIYSVILFLLGIVGIFKKIPNRVIIVAVAFVGFLATTIYMFTIPLPFS